MAVILRRDVTVERLAHLVGLTGPTLTGWKRGSQPKKQHLEAVEHLAVKMGLPRYSARYLDYGPEGNQVSKAPMLKGKRATEIHDQKRVEA